MKIRHCVGVAGGLMMLSMGSHASAAVTDTPFAVSARAAMVQVDNDGARGRLTGGMEDMGPGAEQAVVVYVPETKRIVAVWMMSFMNMEYGQNQRQYGPWQVVCKSYELRADGPPVVVSDSSASKWPYMKTGPGIVALTNNQTNRPGNHPRIATDGKHVALVYGTNFNNNGRTYTNIQALDSSCRALTDPMKVSRKADEDEGAPDIVFTGMDANGSAIFTGAYASNNGDDVGVVPFQYRLTDTGQLVGMSEVWTAYDTTTQKGVITPTNVARPLIASLDGNRTLVCAAKGDNRPPEIGVECVTMSPTGTVSWRSLVAPSDMRTRKYMNQPSLARLPDGKIALNAIESNAMGRGTNNKGINLSHLYMLEPNGDAFTIKSEVTGIASYQTHASICSGKIGEAGSVGIGVISASPSGVGRPMFMTVKADTAAFSFTRHKEWPIGFYGDSGHLANWYGANPMKQGRDFMQCIGDVPNPGYHQANGFMADVESFFVSAVSGRVPGNMKNTIDMALIPGKQDREATPQNPTTAQDVPLGQTEPTETPKAPAPKSESGCACSTPGTTTSNDMAGLAVLGLGLAAVVSRRRKQNH